jgi:acyl carrier protein
MAPNALEDKFFTILSSMLTVPREKLDRDSSRETLSQWDSLGHMHLMLALEDEFDIEFDDAEIATLNSAGALLDVVATRGRP